MKTNSAIPKLFNKFQYDQLLLRPYDAYTDTKYQILQSLMATMGPMRILNVGCGTGELSGILVQMGHYVYGIDPESEHISVAKQRVRGLDSTQYHFEVTSIESYQPKELFDCIVSADVLEHIEDDESAFKKMVDCLKPSGLILIVVPEGQWLFGRHDRALGHYRRYSKSQLLKLARRYCQVESVRSFGISLIPICLWFSKFGLGDYPILQTGDGDKRPWISKWVRSILKLDAKLALSPGISLILRGHKAV